MEDYQIRVMEWLAERVRQAEKMDPQLRILKDRINDLAEKMRSLSGEQIAPFLREQDQAIQDLINHVSSKNR